MPDYYRWMPGYQTDPVTRLEMENIWRANDVRYTQIDWDEFYRQNRNSKDGSATYLMEDRVSASPISNSSRKALPESTND